MTPALRSAAVRARALARPCAAAGGRALALAAPLALVALLQLGCANAPEAGPPPDRAGTALPVATGPALLIAPISTTTSAAITAAVIPAAAATVDIAAYPWLTDSTCAAQSVTGPLASRFAPPAGWQRAPLAAGSFGAWLRGLPLRPPGPVVDYKGRVVLAPGDPRFAAVIALDEGRADLQQCADSIMRLHAEWQWSRGAHGIRYRAASGAAMPFESWRVGQRPFAEGNALVWKTAEKPVLASDHGAFRKYLDAVFNWANTGALARDAAKVTLETVRPGDFFVLAGAPGHAVLILDLALGPGGERAFLLGQGYMPAQSFHVLRPAPDAAWFVIDPPSGGLQTPFWPAPFPWTALRRLD